MSAFYSYFAKRRVIVLLAILLTIGSGFFLQKALVTQLTASMLPLMAASAGLDLHWKQLRAGLFAPIVLEGVQATSTSSETSINASKIVLDFSDLWKWWKGQRRVFSRITIENLGGVIDFRSASTPSKKQFFEMKDELAFPLALEIQASDLNLLFDRVTYRFRNLSASLNENSLGAIEYSFAKVETVAFERSLPAASALATWRAGTLSLTNWTLFPGCVIELTSLNFLDPDGLGVDFDMSAFGGTIKGSLTRKTREKIWDVALVAQRVDLNLLAKALESQASVQGILKEGKLTFRGRTKDLLNAEASVRIRADGFRWNNLGWQTLEFGADLIHHRIAVPEFRLRQKENSLQLKGSAFIPDDFRNFSKAPFEISLAGDFQDLGELAGLLGPTFRQLHGRMTLDGSFWSSAEGPNGYFKLEASPLHFQGIQFTSARIDTVVRNGNVDVTSCELWNGNDSLLGHGIVDLKSPHQYSGEMQLRTQQIAVYAPLLGEAWRQRLHSGGLVLSWQGDGTSHQHSGAFSLQVDHLLSTFTPRGISGRLEGTFSPGYISLNRLELLSDPLRLTTQVFLTPPGVTINDLQVRKGSKQVAWGSAFLPIDVFALASGASWTAALRSEKPTFLSLDIDKVRLADLCNLTGQNSSLPCVAQLHFLAEEEASLLKLDGRLSMDPLTVPRKGFPSYCVRASVETSRKTANFAADVLLGDTLQAQMRGLFPLSFKQDGFFSRKRPFQAILQVAQMDLAVFQRFLPDFSRLKGKGTANLTARNTLGAPKIDGFLTVSGGMLQLRSGMPVLSNLQLDATVRDNQMFFRTFRGRQGAGTFTMNGSVDFSVLTAPRLDLRLDGQKMLLWNEPELTVQANARFLAQGTPHSGMLSGTIQLENSVFRRDVEVVPTLPSTIALPLPIQHGDNALSEKGVFPFAAWKVDVSVSNNSPFLVKTKLTNGELIPHLHLGGMLGKILPSGSIEFKNLRAFFPFAIAEVPKGTIFFDPKLPGEPLLNAGGFVDLAAYTMEITAVGPFDRPELFFSSRPPLSQVDISLLLLGGKPLEQEQIPSPTSRMHLGMLWAFKKYDQKFQLRGLPDFSFMSNQNLYEFVGSPLEYSFQFK